MPSLFPIPKKIDDSPDSFGKDEYGAFLNFVQRKVKYIKAKNKGLREELLPKWARIYKGIPAEERKTFPWPDASNLIVQLAATHADELLSRVMAIYANDPLFVCKILGDFDNGAADDQREALEFFMADAAVDPAILDLYRVEEIWWSSTIRYGTGLIKFPWEYVTEKQYVYIGGGTEPGTEATHTPRMLTRRDGPHPENVPLNRFGIDPKCSTLSNSDFFYHTISYDRYELDRLKQNEDIFNKEAIEYILNAGSDRIGPDEFERQNEEQKKAQTEPNELAPKWDLDECWFSYWKDGDKYQCIAYYHEPTNTMAGAIFNPYPDHIQPFEDAKLAYDDDTYHGFGFCEMLESYQREISTTHNYRVDNRQFSTTGIGRVNKNSKLSSLLQVHPGILIPADKDEVEFFPPNTAAGLITTEDEQLTLALAKERSGVDPAIGGSGAGMVNSKKGNFSTQGMSVMQWQNNRNNLRMSDMRSAHVRMGRKLLRLYAEFGLGTAIRKYGDRAQLLKDALNNYKAEKLGLVIKPATASYNREVEKQNDILLSATLERLYAGDAQILQALAMPGMPPSLKNYYVEVFAAKNQLMKHILRNFGHDDASRLIPVPDELKQARANATGAGGNGQVTQTQAPTGGAVPVGGLSTAGGVPQSPAGGSGGSPIQ